MSKADDSRLFRHFDLYARGVISAHELFPSILDSFSDGGAVANELEEVREDLQGRIRAFLETHRPATFRPFLIGPGPTPEESAQWEQRRRRIYAALLQAMNLG
jgi:hypothetical protein